MIFDEHPALRFARIGPAAVMLEVDSPSPIGVVPDPKSVPYLTIDGDADGKWLWRLFRDGIVYAKGPIKSTPADAILDAITFRDRLRSEAPAVAIEIRWPAILDEKGRPKS